MIWLPISSSCSLKDNKEQDTMPEWLSILLLLAGYLIVMKVVLPRLGVPT